VVSDFPRLIEKAFRGPQKSHGLFHIGRTDFIFRLAKGSVAACAINQPLDANTLTAPRIPGLARLLPALIAGAFWIGSAELLEFRIGRLAVRV